VQRHRGAAAATRAKIKIARKNRTVSKVRADGGEKRGMMGRRGRSLGCWLVI